MGLIMPITIALVMAVVAGAVVWLVWSVFENLAAKRKSREGSPPPAGASDSEEPKSA